MLLKKILRSATHGSTESWALHGFGRHVVRPWIVPNLGMAYREFELWTGSDMASSDLEFGLKTGPVRGLADPELAYCSRLGLDPNWQTQSSNSDMGWADPEFSLRTGSNMGLTYPEFGLRIWFLGPAWKF